MADEAVLRKPDNLLEWLHAKVPQEVDDLLHNAGALAELLSIGIDPGPGGAKQAATFLAGPKKGMKVMPWEATTGTPIKISGWRSGKPNPIQPYSFFFDNDEIYGPENYERVAYLNKRFGIKPELHQETFALKNPLVSEKDQFNLMRELFGGNFPVVWNKKDLRKAEPWFDAQNLDFSKVHNLVPKDNYYLLLDNILEQKARLMGHDGIIYRQGSTLGSPDRWTLNNNISAAEIQRLR